MARELLKPSEAMKMLGCGRRYLMTLINAGYITAKPVYGLHGIKRWEINAASVRAYIARTKPVRTVGAIVEAR